MQLLILLFLGIQTIYIGQTDTPELCPVWVKAEPVTLFTRVYEFDAMGNSVPINGVRISTEFARQEAMTNEAGEALINGRSGGDNLKLEKEGYLTRYFYLNEAVKGLVLDVHLERENAAGTNDFFSIKISGRLKDPSKVKVSLDGNVTGVTPPDD